MESIVPKYFVFMLISWVILLFVANTKFKQLHDKGRRESNLLHKYNKKLQHMINQPAPNVSKLFYPQN